MTKRRLGVLAAFAFALVVLTLWAAVMPKARGQQDSLPFWLVKKREIAAREDAAMDAGFLNQASVPPHPETAGPAPSPPEWESGLFGRNKADLPSGLGFDSENMWRGRIEGRLVAVYAGSQRRLRETDAVWIDTAEGRLLVMKINPDTWEHTFRSYTPPVPGAVRIMSATGPLLKVVSEANGRAVTFDAATGDFDK